MSDINSEEISLRAAREQAGYSLRHAAGLLGISHAYLSGLELGHKSLDPQRAHQIAKVYNLDSKLKLAQPLPADKDEFVGWLQEQIKWWDSRFVLPKIPAVTRLITQLNVDPNFILEDGGSQTKLGLLHSFFTDEANRALLMQGSIGSGKSFFMRMLTLETNGICQQLKLEKRYVPILVSLGEFEILRGSFLQSLTEYYRQHNFSGSMVQLERFFKQCLDKGNALLLFDGLDEINSNQRRVKTLALLQQFYEDQVRKRGNRMIISGRDDAFFERDRAYEGFTLVRLESWHSLQMHEACQKWSFEDDEELNRFMHVLQANDSLYRLAKWPLLFHLLTTLYSTSGLKPFQERTGLCEDCCDVLENTWDSARRMFQRQSNADETVDALERHPWLKWRHFLIYLMQRTLVRTLEMDGNIKLSFSVDEMKEAWECFLLDKGISRQSLDFTRLEDLITHQNRIGPMFQHRAILVKDERSEFSERFSFLDPIFGLYYYSKALINMPDKLEQFVVKHIRSDAWEDVIPLTIEELGRSERTYENELGERLIQAVLATDDELNLDGEHHIGNFRNFVAMRSIMTYNIDRYWNQIVEPFLDVYMNSMYESNGTVGNHILGEYSASSKLRKFFLQRLETLPLDATMRIDEKWRVLAALGRFGEKTDYIVDELVRDIDAVTKKQGKATLLDKISMRRLLWSLRQIGRIFVLDDTKSVFEPYLKARRIEKINNAIMQFVDFAIRAFETELKTGRYSKVNYWDVLTVVLETEYHLQYRQLMKRTLNDLCSSISDHFDVCFSTYPHRSSLLQFLKGGMKHSYLLSSALVKDLEKKFENVMKQLPTSEQNDLKAALVALQKRQAFNQGEITEKELFKLSFGKCDRDMFTKWVDVVAAQANELQPDYCEIGLAISGILLFNDEIIDSEGGYDLKHVIEVVMRALEVEVESDEAKKDGERSYTRPFSCYGYPLYDHIYNCAVSLARRLPGNVRSEN